MSRILVGQLWQESHDFNPVLTEASDFAVERGEDMLRANAQAVSTLGGILRTLTAYGATLVPTLAARARPGGPVRREVYEGFKAAILDAARAAPPVDAAVFELHGAMTAEGIESTEADLMAALREVLGPQVVIAIGLDLHGHVTDALLRACDIVTACKENPHSDTVEAGERAATFALGMLAGTFRPATTMVKLPLLLSGGMETVDRPLADLHDAARAALAAQPALRDISIFNVHPYHNVGDLGQAVIAIAADDHAPADAASAAIARDMWAWRDRFRDDFLTTDAALDLVAAHPDRRPFVLSDAGDRVLAGAPGDGLEILARLRQRGLKLKGVFPVTDPAAAAAAIAAGQGATIELSVGATVTRGFTPVRLTWRVVRTDPVGDFVQKGPFQGGQRSTLGPCAVLADDAGNLVLVTTAAAMTQDPAAFTSQGIDLSACDFVVAKSGNHFKLSFAGVAEPVMIRTAGMSAWTPGFFPYDKSRFYPEDRTVTVPTLRLRRFGRNNPSDSEIPA